jgi:hypothetical protein
MRKEKPDHYEWRTGLTQVWIGAAGPYFCGLSGAAKVD